MSMDSNDLFTRITPLDSQHAGNVLHKFNLLCQTAAIFAFSSLWCVLTLMGLFLNTQGASAASAGLGIFLLSFVWVGIICTLAFVYPEWPHNRRLCRQLLRNVQRGASCVISPSDPPPRVVELVPRERWKKLCLDTATDLMTIQVDQPVRVAHHFARLAHE